MQGKANVHNDGVGYYMHKSTEVVHVKVYLRPP
jgi:hypothetical protein